MGLFKAMELIGSLISEELTKATVYEGYQEALETMEKMPANNGQISVYENFVVPLFEETFFLLLPEAGEVQWEPVDIGEYMDFMGEIVEAGNQIMEQAFDEAIRLQEGIEAATEGGPDNLAEALEELGEIIGELDDEV